MITRRIGFTPKQLLRAIRYATRGARARLLFRVLRHRSRELPISPAKVCEFENLDEYERNHSELAALLRTPGKLPPNGEKDFLRRMGTRPSSAGTINPHDYSFLTAFTGLLAPSRVVEIGTLTGFSAAILAAALHRQHGTTREFRVDTIDNQRQCVIDKSQPTGFEIESLIPEIAASVFVHTPYDSSIVAQLANRDELGLAFIDADHQHPRPLLDLIRLAPYLHGGSWIILHDTQLSSASELVPEGERMQYGTPGGAEWLFARWPFPKISGGNIGAIQLPDDKTDLISFALNLLAIPSEVRGESGARTRAAVLYSLSALF